METPDFWNGPGQRKKTWIQRPSQPSTALSFFIFGKGSDHAPTRPVWHTVDIFCVWEGLTFVIFGTSHTLLYAGR